MNASPILFFQVVIFVLGIMVGGPVLYFNTGGSEEEPVKAVPGLIQLVLSDPLNIQEG